MGGFNTYIRDVNIKTLNLSRIEAIDQLSLIKREKFLNSFSILNRIS